MSTRHTPAAFTLVELIMVIVIIGLLSAVVVPKYGDIKSNAQTAAESGAVSAIRSGIGLVHMTNLVQGSDTYPAALDSAATGKASETNKLFTNVIDDGVSDTNWEKINATTYKYNPTGNSYVYNSTTGKFTKQ